MGVKKGQEIELTITDLAFGGRGLARVEGMAVFVDQTAPGDRVVARIVRRKKRHAEARVVKMLAPSPYRVPPPCRYSGFCGGCKWQFLDYDRQIAYKRRHVADSMAHLALLDGVDVRPTLASEAIFHYRNKMEFSCSDRRWLLPDELGDERIPNDFALGLHVPGTFNKVLDIDRCLLQPETGNRILAEARSFILASGLPPYGLRSHEGFWRFVTLRHSVAYDRWMVNVVTSAENPGVMQRFAERLTAAVPAVAAVVNNVSARRAGIAVGEFEKPVWGDGVLHEKIGRLVFEVSANSFFQTNTRGAERLYETVRAYADLDGSETVVDLYCGTGTISLFLADAARRVIGLEIVESAVADARKNCVSNGVGNCTFIAGDIRDSLAAIECRPEVMIIDPPRVGMHKDVVGRVMELAPDKIVYVSCNPATLARDIGLLKEAYSVNRVQPVDMFPHTFHIESVAKLVRNGS